MNPNAVIVGIDSASTRARALSLHPATDLEACCGKAHEAPLRRLAMAWR